MGVRVSSGVYALAAISVLISAIALASGRRSTARPPSYRQLRLRAQALTIQPAGGLCGTVSIDELRSALRLVEPRLRVPKVNHLLHALRLWGAHSSFDLEPFDFGVQFSSSERLLDVLTDSLDAENSGIVPYPFLYRSRYGVGVHVGGGGSVAHVDQYLWS
jgi:hypothetical protein